ncbi:histidine kinase [Streptomonospora wellingtoniae]|uniref:Histidine kinase n=1 Tax=Streptomonospora wellingtoniae TaxID=3075544 RepID=A0ABU2KWG2_9ACTN|nr:histidine kinase [Streptomonospora sp. DSM 45055]MDT0303636.1 histidine kinase [Streptomonospora sp. DSM 45055]
MGLGALTGGPHPDLAAGAVLACAAAFAVGLAARPAGLVLAAAAPLAALRVPGPPAGPGVLGAAGPEGASAPWWIVLAAVCLLGALTPGRISLDALLARRRQRRLRGGAGADPDDERIGRRPEEAPPLPYPGARVESPRPSRI